MTGQTQLDLTLMTRSPHPSQWSRGFVVQAIGYAQSRTMDDPKVACFTDYLMAAHLLAWDDQRCLVWVNHPDSGWQVAVWLMPVAMQFQPAVLAGGAA